MLMSSTALVNRHKSRADSSPTTTRMTFSISCWLGYKVLQLLIGHVTQGVFFSELAAEGQVSLGSAYFGHAEKVHESHASKIEHAKLSSHIQNAFQHPDILAGPTVQIYLCRRLRALVSLQRVEELDNLPRHSPSLSGGSGGLLDLFNALKLSLFGVAALHLTEWLKEDLLNAQRFVRRHRSSLAYW